MLAKFSARCPPRMGSSRGFCTRCLLLPPKSTLPVAYLRKPWVCFHHGRVCWNTQRGRESGLLQSSASPNRRRARCTIVTTLAVIRQALGFSDAGLQWVFPSYALVFGGLLIFGGRVADLAVGAEPS